MSLSHDQRGFTVIELLVAASIAAIVGTALFMLISRGYDLNRRETAQIQAQEQAREAVETTKPEIRQLEDSEAGAYAIDTATSSTFIFYSDVDDDGETERVNYHLDGSDFMRGIVEPAGDPLSYDIGTETDEEIVTNVVDANIFSYYDENFAGTEDPLAFPVDVTDIRLVGVSITVDALPGEEPDAFVLSDRVQLRNLKDNL